MKISYNWVKQYANIELDINDASEILTDIGLEVEGIENFQTIKGGLEGLIIGEVKTCIKHPDADKLSLTTVDVGKENLLNIVCGAPNVSTGQKVVVAPIGTSLFFGDEQIKLKKTKIRGKVSEGMICAEDEIGLGNSHDGILVLDQNAKVGNLAKDYFEIENDTIFEIGLTPNRIDGASHYGVARDIVAFLNQTRKIELKKPSVDDFKIDNQNLKIEVDIENFDACPRYSGITISGIEVKESPDWLKNRLLSINQKPINNIVDITNYVLHETAQPLHAFDADKIEGNKIIVKTLTHKTKFTTLDETERELSADDLMICNAKSGMCIAGVFGGIDSGVSEKTKDIFLESAHFNPAFVRKTSKFHNLNTDSSFRFERGSDPNNTIYALKRAALLIKEIAGGKISSDIIDIYPKKIEPLEIKISYSNIHRLIGKSIGKNKIKNILESLDIEIISEDENELFIKIPTYRVDVQREADVIEEILRIYGYNNIEISNHVNSSIQYSQKPDKEKLKNIVSEFLINNGFNEMMANSLTKSEYYENSDTAGNVFISNPLSRDLNTMRRTLLYGGLEAIAYNSNRKNFNLKLFEFGWCYSKISDNLNEEIHKQFFEEEHFALFITGNKSSQNWNLKTEPTNFYQLKGYVENILTKIGIDINSINSNEISNQFIDIGLNYKLKNKSLVNYGFVSKKLLKNFDIENDVFYADFNWSEIIPLIKNNKITFNEISKYPEVKRDLALLIDKKIKFEQIKNIAYKTEKKLLQNISLFDVYEGKQIADNKKSYAISFILQDIHKTLTDKQIDKIMNKLIYAFKKELDAEIR